MNVNISKFGESENAVGIVDSRYPNRWLDVFGPDVDKVLIDRQYDVSEWTITATGTSPVAASLVPGAVALITSGGSDFDGDNMQVVGSMFKLDVAKPVYFGAKVTINEATQSDLVVGLFGIDTTLTAASSAHALAVGAGGAGFTKLDNTTACLFKTFTTATEKNSVAASTMDTSAHIYEMFWDGYKLSGYIDGALVGTFTADITTEVLTPSIAFRTGSAAAKTCTIHWLRAFAVRS